MMHYRSLFLKKSLANEQSLESFGLLSTPGVDHVREWSKTIDELNFKNKFEKKKKTDPSKRSAMR